MDRFLSRAAALALLGALNACTPTARLITKPVAVEPTERIVKQRVPSKLLRVHEVAEGPLRSCPEVAAARKRELLQCNADKRELGSITEQDE